MAVLYSNGRPFHSIAAQVEEMVEQNWGVSALAVLIKPLFYPERGKHYFLKSRDKQVSLSDTYMMETIHCTHQV